MLLPQYPEVRMRLSAEESRRRAAGADHGVLSTARPDGSIDSVPVCFAIDGDLVVTAIDDVKPKAGGTLRRVADLEADPRATLLCERWDPDDWSNLWWTRLRLRRQAAPASAMAALEAALRRRYRQYAEATFAAVLVFRIDEATGWSAEREPETPDRRRG
jgi:PPOX class probable F420-dependent enzyme